MDISNFGRPGRNRTQVGTTNRHSIIPPKTLGSSSRESHHCRRGVILRRSPTSITPRSASSSNGGAHAASSRSQTLSNNRVRKMVSSSRSMPALSRTGTGNGAYVGERGETPRRVKTAREDSASQQLGKEDEGQRDQPTPADYGYYLTSAQLAHVSGLKSSESDVLIVDPYRHRSLLHDRWVNRACQRLAHLTNIKYGSVREFFRMYDADCDGVLDFDEFSRGITMCQLDHLFPRSLQRALFDRIDTDKSGSVELDEFAEFLNRGMAQGVLVGAGSARQERELLPRRKTVDVEVRSVELQPIHDHRTQRIKNKVCHYLNKVVPYASAGLADDRAIFLKKQFALLHGDAPKRSIRGIRVEDLSRALGSRGMNLGVSDDDLDLLMREMDSSGDGVVTLKEFAAFLNLDDHEPLYQSLFDARRRNVNILQAFVDLPPPAATPEELYIRERAKQLHLAAVPSAELDTAVRIERSKREKPSIEKRRPYRANRSESPPWTVTTKDSVTVSVSAGSGCEVVDVWDLPPPTRRLSSTKRLLTSSMRSLPQSVASGTDGANTSFGSAGGPFAMESPQETTSAKDEQRLTSSGLSSLSSSGELFASLEEARLEEAAAGTKSRSRKVPEPTWTDIGHGGEGHDAGTDESSSFHAYPEERFTTVNSERFGPLMREKHIEKGRRSAWFYRRRTGDAAAGASTRQERSEIRSNRIRQHLERIALTVKAEEVVARLKDERRVRGKARLRLRYGKWVNNLDNWLTDEAPRLADFSKRQFPEQNTRLRGGQQVFEALGGPSAIAAA